MENKNISKTKFNPGSILLLVGLLLIAVGVALTTFVPQEDLNNEKTNPPSEEPQSEINNKLGQTIELSKETEDITFDSKLRIKFIGAASADMGNAYKYKAEIYLNNELVNHNFYTGSNIYSKDYAANFTVHQIENTYIIQSFIAKQCNGSDILVLNAENKEIQTYADVSFELAKEENKYIIIKCLDCMNETSCQKQVVEVPKLTK